MSRRPRAVLHALVVVALSAAMAAPAASAHSTFLESTPRPGAQLATPPSRIVMVYTEPLNERLTTLRLISASSGETVPANVRVTGGRRLELLPRERLPQGAYRLDWRSVSTIDAHIREGSVGFGVGTAALGGAVDIGGNPLADAGALRIAVRWVFYAALLFFAGGVLNAALRGRHSSPGYWLVPRAAGQDGLDPTTIAAVADQAWRRTVFSARFAALAGAATVAVETAQATGGFAATAWASFLTTGSGGLTRLSLVMSLAVGAVVVSRAPRAAAIAAVSALLSLALGGHASGADPRWLAVLSNLLHLVAAAIWLGGLAHIARAWLPTLRRGSRALRRAVVGGVLPRFGQVALPAFAVVAVTGSVNALVQLGAVADLWSTAYGRVLLLKTALVAAIAGISYVHAFRLRPRMVSGSPGAPPPEGLERRHRRLLGSEAPMGIAVLAAAAVLVAFPVPPREARAAGSSLGLVEPCDPCPFAAPQPGELAVGAPLGQLTAGVWLRRDGPELAGTLRIIDAKRSPAAVSASIRGATGTVSCGSACWRFRLPRSARTVEVTADTERGTMTARLPARWKARGDAEARRLLARSQRTMRRLETFSMVETVTSAAGRGGGARTELDFEAPDRLAYTTPSNSTIVIGRQHWVRTDSLPGWQRLTPADEPLRVRDGFRWTVLASTARLLRRDRRTAELALFDYGYPIWYRLKIDRRTGRALEARLVTPENRIHHRYKAFNRPVRIDAPVAGS